MPTLTAYAKPVNGVVTIRVPTEYDESAFEVMLIPIPGEMAGTAEHSSFRLSEKVSASCYGAELGQEASDMFSFLMSEHGSRKAGYVFDREEANARQ